MGGEGALSKGARDILELVLCVSFWSWATSPPSPTSVKFINKIQYVHSLEDLEQLIPMEHVQIPDCVLQ